MCVAGVMGQLCLIWRATGVAQVSTSLRSSEHQRQRQTHIVTNLISDEIEFMMTTRHTGAVDT